MTNAEGMSSIFLAIIEHQIDLQFWARFCVIDGSFLYGWPRCWPFLCSAASETARPAQTLGLSGRFWQQLGLPARSASSPPVSRPSLQRQHHISQSLWLCVLELVGPYYLRQQTNVSPAGPLETQSANNILLRADPTLWSVCVGFTSPLTMTCMYLRSASGQKLLWLHGLRPIKNLCSCAAAAAASSQFPVSEACCGRFPSDFHNHEMRGEFPLQARTVFPRCITAARLLSQEVLACIFGAVTV